MILFQPDIESQSNPYEAQATRSISQLIKFNCSARRRKGKTAIHHNIDHESPLPLYFKIFLNFLEQSNLAMILQLLTVGAHELECRLKEKFQLLNGQRSTFPS